MAVSWGGRGGGGIKAQILRPGKSRALDRAEPGWGVGALSRGLPTTRRLFFKEAVKPLHRVPPPAQPRFRLPGPDPGLARRPRESPAGCGDGVQTLPAQGRERGAESPGPGLARPLLSPDLTKASSRGERAAGPVT